MKKIIKSYIKNNPIIMKYLLRYYNRVFGRNRIRIPFKNYYDLGAVLITKTRFKINGHGNVIVIKDFSRLTDCDIYIRGNDNKILIDGWTHLNAVRLSIEDDRNEITIGDHTTIFGYTHLSLIEGTSIKIGAHCLFSGDVYFRTGDSHAIVDLNGRRLNKSETIIVGDHVWIGTRVMVLKGAQIGNNCVH